MIRLKNKKELKEGIFTFWLFKKDKQRFVELKKQAGTTSKYFFERLLNLWEKYKKED